MTIKPLQGIHVVEFASLAPAPFACMMLGDLGASILRIDRPQTSSDAEAPLALQRGRHSLTLDLKSPDGVERALEEVAKADVVVEGFRPGVMERLGLGPDDCGARNSELVYARMTGWGQRGPLANTAAHDVNYLAISGVLHTMGSPAGTPPLPLNLLGDYAGGGLVLTLGVLAALRERERTGVGVVIDSAIIDGLMLLSTQLYGEIGQGSWSETRGTNLLDGSAPFYSVYEAADRRYLAVGALEPKFFDELVSILDLERDACYPQYDRSLWPRMRTALENAFRSKDRDEWWAVFADTDACVTPVLLPREAMAHPHAVERDSFVGVNGIPLPRPAPRFAPIVERNLGGVRSSD